VGRRVRIAAGLLALTEVVVFVLVAGWIGAGLTVLLALATSALGWVLLARQGTKALADLRESTRTPRAGAGRELGDAGLVAAGGVLMVLPGFISDVVGLLFLLPVTRPLVRAASGRVVVSRLPVGLRPPVRVDSVRTAEMPDREHVRTPPLVIEGEVLRGPDGRPLV
jgi:UPF0716 protein FxsA